MAVINQKVENGGIDPNYYTKIGGAESGNNDRAVNPTIVNGKKASASGKFQFTADTWKGVVDRYGLKYNLNDRFDKNKSQEVMELFTKDNASYLKTHGIETNNSNLYFAHFLGSAGAVRYINKMNQNPNQSSANVATPSEIAWNKNVFINKDGSYKTAKQSFDLMTNRINGVKNVDYSTQKTNSFISENNNKLPTTPLPEISNFEKPIIGDTFTEEETSDTEREKEQEDYDAKIELQNKQNEENLFNDLLEATQLEYVDPNQVQDYTQEEQQPQVEYQNGGFIKDNRGQWAHSGELTEIASPNITMKNVSYQVLGISKETGEQKMMYPEQDYFFKNTENVLEIPQIKNKNKRFSL